HTRFSRDWSSDVCSSDLPFSRMSCRTSRMAIQLPKVSRNWRESLFPSTQRYGWWKQQFTESVNSGLTKCLLNSQESLERLRLRSLRPTQSRMVERRAILQDYS